MHRSAASRLAKLPPGDFADASEVPLEEGPHVRQSLLKPAQFPSFDGSLKTCDVLVVGGSPAGVSAALAAARRGAKVVLVETRGHLGGDIPYQMMNMWDVPLRPGSTLPVVRGIFEEFFNELGVAFDTDRAMHLLENTVAAEPKLHAFVNTDVDHVEREGSRVRGAVLRKDTGETFPLEAAAVVDATDDASFAVRAGSGYFTGRQKTNPDCAMQSAGLLFSLKGVDWKAIRGYVKSTKLRKRRPGEERRVGFSIDLKFVNTPSGPMVKERLGGTVENYIWESGELIKAYRPLGPNIQLLSINFGRQGDGSVVLNTLNILGVNGLKKDSLRQGREEALRELPHLLEYLRHTVPGFKKAQIEEIAPELYIRETRHIQGLYQLTADDVIHETRFPDRVALASYPLDLHPYKRGEENPLAPQRYSYTIPLRSLVVSRVDGVFVASRSLSANSAAAGSARVLPITMACGEAVGAAAWLCAEHDITPHQLAADPNRIRELQASLIDWGADIGDTFPNFNAKPAPADLQIKPVTTPVKKQSKTVLKPSRPLSVPAPIVESPTPPDPT